MNRQVDRISGKRREELLAILPTLRRFGLSLTGNLADADDLLQSTVERVLARGLPGDAELQPWCFKVCRNLWIDELRTRKVRSKAASDPALGADDIFPGEEQVIGEISLREVQLAMADMSEEQRSVLELVAVEGFSYKEAAEVLDVPIGTVMSRLARARTALLEKTGNDAVTN
jgi:RNA polymerase sigma-70 factor (ECF subfamily)